MSKQDRLNFYNSWPNGTLFPAEIQFGQRIAAAGVPLFVPIQVNANLTVEGHISLSYVLDALGSLPRRPDHSFDWAWKAFEHLTKKGAPNLNITEALRVFAVPRMCSVLNNDGNASIQFNEFVSKIPMQTARFMLKKIIKEKPYVVPASSFAKRLLLANGNGPITSQALQALLDKLSGYNYSNASDRRKGASLLCKALTGQVLIYPLGQFALSQQDRILLLVSGLGYGFRNDRTHANAISPFTSSKARVKTYAHCWFSFLLIYYSLTMLWANNGFVPAQGALGVNYSQNNAGFMSLFSNVLGD
ncbi:hypothetical protein D7U89_22315 [Stenotrophomonas maltophilia]|uniref:hypothetical protein n=1 Tax=Stenotrophomonas TaxID=40323 RepID=UPI0013129D6D|nr:hypothetical protein [Stenotrophomonas maltophilia]MBA0228180.1 hypothetical protein [Stenotrophomonas maltophilia]MBA0369033.1 hypothetical protein [Stenotrophomonas maltophilia]MBA0402932.1 hypothetical protein [Stenotrophomonas maltophilia]MCF3521430.1 hypothetical protein [Stenotrophomonas maltophilia]